MAAPASAPAADAALAFNNVTKIYAYSHLGRTVTSRGIRGLNLELAPGEVFGLLGLNGSGKTTTMKLGLGLLAPTSGTVTVFGKAAGSPQALSQMGYLPELPYFYPYLNPREILGFFARLSDLPRKGLKEKIEDVLELVGLKAHADRRMSTFSKGMLQRVGMAQALIHDPKLILLDEPVSGLDPLAITEFRDLFNKLNESGKALLLSSHSISEVERLCHRAGILVDGRLVRILKQKDWSREAGHLEKLFVDTVRN